MSEIVFDYSMFDFLSNKTKSSVINEWKTKESKELGTISQEETLIIVNRERALHGLKPVKIGVVKYHWN
jgi:uncharacterized protein YkwD